MSDHYYKNIIYNTLSGCLRLFVNALILICLTPFIIKQVGIDGYGIWSLVISVVGFFELLDFGLGTAVIKYVGNYRKLDDYPKCNQVVSTLLTSYVVLSLMGLAGIGLMSLFFNSLFDIPTEYQTVALYLLGIIGMRSLLVILPLSLFKGILFAGQHIYLINFISLIVLLFYALGAWIALSHQMGLLALASLNLFGAVIEYTLYAVFTFYLDRKISISWSYVNLTVFKEILPFSLAQLMSNVGSLVLLSSDLIIIKLFLPLSEVGMYAIPLKVITYCYMLLSQFTHILTPVVVDTYAIDKHKKMHSLFIQGTKYVLVPSTIISVAGILCSREILSIWISKEIEIVAPVFMILLFAMWVTTTYSLAGGILQMTGYHNNALVYAWIGVMSKLISSVILINFLELNGVALGTLLAAFTGLFLEFRKVCSICQISWREYLGSVIPMFMVPAIAQGAFLWFLKLSIPVKSLLGLFCINILPMLAFLLVAWLMLGQSEKMWIRKSLLARGPSS